MVKFRRTVSFDDDVLVGLNRYRAEFLKEGKEKRFGPAVNELLREILEEKGCEVLNPVFPKRLRERD